MKEKISRFFILLSFILLIVVIGWTGMRLYTLKTENSSAAEKNFNTLRKTVVSSYLAHSSFDSLHFRTTMESFFKKNDRIRALVIFSKPGITYLYAVHPSYITVFPGSSAFPRSNDKGESILDPRSFFESDFTAGLQIPKHDDMILSSVYNIVTSDELFQVLRDSGIAFAFLVVIFVIFLIIVPKTSKPQPKKQAVDIEPEQTPPRNTSHGSVEKAPASTGQTEDKSKGLFSPHSGLGWEDYLENRLNFELRRSASFDQDLVLVFFSSHQLQKEKAIYRRTAESIVDYFTFQDLTFEFKDNGFSIILPNTELDEAIKKMEFFLKKLASLDFETTPIFSVGLSSRNGRLLSAQRLIHEAAKAIEKAQAHNKTKIVGFRSDPVKYRKYIASKM